jgi:hypothetical protein
VAAVERFVGLVIYADVIERVPGHEHDAIWAPAQFEARTFLHADYSVFGYGQELAEDGLPFVTEDLACSFCKLGHIGHVWHSTSVEDSLGVGDLTYQPSCPPTVIHVYVGRDDILDIVRVITEVAKGS